MEIGVKRKIMCTRITPDPLLSLFFEKYKVHLLSTPRENIDVGEVYIHEKGHTMAPGNLSGILSDFVLPMPHRLEEMADLSGGLTNQIKLGGTLNLLKGILSSIGMPDFLSRLRAESNWNNKTEVQFSFSRIWRDWLDVVELGTSLIGTTLNKEHPLISKGRKYFVTTAVLRTSKISIEFSNEKARAATLDAESLIGGIGTVSVSKDGSLKIESKKPLAFGVELHELEFIESEKRFILKVVPRPMNVRSAIGSHRRQTYIPAEIGGKDANPMLDVQYMK